jgi:hypothetical protein
MLPVALLFARVDVISSAADQVVLDLTLPMPELTTVSAAGTDWSVLALPEAGINPEPGMPQLPVVRKLIEIPYGATPEVVVADARTARLALPNRLYPVQPPVPKSGPLPGFAFAAKAYSAAGYAPEPWARIAGIAEVRNHRVALLEIQPVHYGPTANAAEYLTSARITVRLPGSDLSETRRRWLDYYSPEFENLLRGIAVNFGAYQTDPPPALPVGYLIITPDAWYDNVLPLAQWRRQRGYAATVTKLSEIGGGSAPQVLAYLQQAYDNWPVKPSYVLLTGDVDNIGYFTGQGPDNPLTDLNYSLLSGSDYLPDICVSRASVADAAQLDSLVAKTIKYEKNQWLNGTEWCRKAFFIGSADAGNHTVTEGTHRYCMATIRPFGVICDSQYLYYSNTRQTTMDKLNEGRAWCIYSGHGGETEWAEHSPQFDVAATHALANTDKTPFVATFACLSGSYASVGECFSESWIRAGDQGAISHLASSVTSYWTEDDTLQRRLFDCLYDSSYTWVMSAITRAKLWYFDQMGNNSTTRRYFEMYNLMGDGAVDIYSDVPAPLTVTYPSVIPLGAYNLHVTVERSGTPVGNALVCAAGRNDTTVHVAAWTNSSGLADLLLTTSAPDSIYLTVTGHNLAPHLGAVLALPSSGPYVMRLRSTIDDAPPGGNADGIVNPGELVNLPTWVKNYGQGAGTAIRGTLRSLDPAVTVTDSVKTFGDIAAGDSAFTGSNGFKFDVSDTCTNGHALGFRLVCRDNRDSTWTSQFAIAVGTGVLAYSAKRVFDPAPGGNNNGRLDPAETAQLFVSLRNSGLGHAYNARAILRSGDARLTVLDSLGTFPLILRDSTAENSADGFQVHADAGILPETQVPCTLIVACDGFQAVRPFSIIISETRPNDPIPDDLTPPLYWAYDDVDSGYTETPPFNWIELRGRGTQLTLSDDQTVQVNLPSGFGPWNYYGQRYTQVSVCGNGFVMPGNYTANAWTNAPLPTTTLAAPAVCLCWDDLYPPTGGGVLWYHDTSLHAFIVAWDSVAYYSPRTQFDKFELVIYDSTLAAPDGSNRVVVQYLTAAGYTSMTAGIQNATQDHGINCLSDGSYNRGSAVLRPMSAIKYTTSVPATAVNEEPARPRATALSLTVSPNPAIGIARIRFNLPAGTPADLRIHDATGRLVRTMTIPQAATGSPQYVSWNGTDQHGRKLGAGVYFLNLATRLGAVSTKTLYLR